MGKKPLLIKVLLVIVVGYNFNLLFFINSVLCNIPYPPEARYLPTTLGLILGAHLVRTPRKVGLYGSGNK